MKLKMYDVIQKSKQFKNDKDKNSKRNGLKLCNRNIWIIGTYLKLIGLPGTLYLVTYYLVSSYLIIVFDYLLILNSNKD